MALRDVGPMSEDGQEDDELAELNALERNHPNEETNDVPSAGGPSSIGFNTIPANYDG